MAGNVVTASVQNEQTVNVLYWFGQNKKNLENMVGGKISTMTLALAADGVMSLSYELVSQPVPEA